MFSHKAQSSAITAFYRMMCPRDKLLVGVSRLREHESLQPLMSAVYIICATWTPKCWVPPFFDAEVGHCRCFFCLFLIKVWPCSEVTWGLLSAIFCLEEQYIEGLSHWSTNTESFCDTIFFPLIYHIHVSPSERNSNLAVLHIPENQIPQIGPYKEPCQSGRGTQTMLQLLSCRGGDGALLKSIFPTTRCHFQNLSAGILDLLSFWLDSSPYWWATFSPLPFYFIWIRIIIWSIWFSPAKTLQR